MAPGSTYGRAGEGVAAGVGRGSSPRASDAGPKDDNEREDLSFVLENDPAGIPPVIALLGAVAARHRLFDEVARGRVELALHEAMLNGIYHGNLELSSRDCHDPTAMLRESELRRHRPPYKDRRLRVRARFTRAGAVYVIRDEGPGFNPGALPDPTEAVNLSRANGRGLLMIRAYMDRVAFNAVGNEIILFKRRAQRTPESSTSEQPGPRPPGPQG